MKATINTCVLLVLLGLISGCTSAKSKQMAPGRFAVESFGFGYQDAFIAEANRVCANRFTVIEQHACTEGPSCVRGTVKCDKN